MRSLYLTACLFLVFSPTAVLADPPKFSSGGVTLQLQYGPGFWHLDREGLAKQTGQANADIMTGDAQDTHTLGIRLAYNILGHASVGVDFNATGWDVTTPNRGGAGFIAGTVAWHPLELVFLNKAQRPIPLDVATFVGFGYGIVGEQRGMDGFLIEWGINVDWFFNRFFGLGLFARCNFLKFGNFYVDYDHRDSPGATIALPDSSGGTFWHAGIDVILRFGD